MIKEKIRLGETNFFVFPCKAVHCEHYVEVLEEWPNKKNKTGYEYKFHYTFRSVGLMKQILPKLLDERSDKAGDKWDQLRLAVINFEPS